MWNRRGCTLSLETAMRGLRSSGVAARAIEHSSVEAVDAAHEKALAPFRREDGKLCRGGAVSVPGDTGLRGFAELLRTLLQ